MRLLLFRLAERLGILVSELEERCSASELIEWAHYMTLERGVPKSEESVTQQLMKVFGGPRGG